MDSTIPLPAHLVEKASQIQSAIRSQLPPQTLLSTWDGLPLNPTTLIEYSLLKPRQVEIVSLDAVSLVEALKEKKYTAVEVVEAYFFSASLAHQATNCLTYFDGDGAMEQAKELDKWLKEKGEVKGVLHGVVISIKRMSPLLHSIHKAGGRNGVGLMVRTYKC
jgi:amidase